MITSGYRLLLPQWIPGVSWLANRLLAKRLLLRMCFLAFYKLKLS